MISELLEQVCICGHLDCDHGEEWQTAGQAYFCNLCNCEGYERRQTVEVNQNWLAGIIEQDERIVSLEAEIATLRAKYAEIQQQLGNARMLLAEQANKLRAYELVESRLWQEVVSQKEAKGE